MINRIFEDFGRRIEATQGTEYITKPLPTDEDESNEALSERERLEVEAAVCTELQVQGFVDEVGKILTAETIEHQPH